MQASPSVSADEPVPLLRHAGDELRSRCEGLRALQRGDAWDAQYEAFELALRFDFYGEPRAAGDASRFYPKLKTLREALRAWEAGGDGDRSFFGALLPRIIDAACVEGLPAARTPLDAPGTLRVERPHALGYLANALLLNAPRSSALDLYGGGNDPLYVSASSRLAVPKLLCVLDAFAREAEDGAEAGTVTFERVDGGCAADEESAGELDLRGHALVGGREAHEEGELGARALLLPLCCATYGGGRLAGLSATDEEALLVCFPEALLGLRLVRAPLGPAEAVLVHGARRAAHVSGAGHQLRYGRAAPAATPVTLVAIDAAAPPGLAQFEPPAVRADLAKALAGFRALRAAAETSAPNPAEEPCVPTPPLATALWGCGGFRGAQPMLRFVLLLLAASLARVTLEVRVPPGYDEHLKWCASVPPRRACPPSVGPESEITHAPHTRALQVYRSARRAASAPSERARAARAARHGGCAAERAALPRCAGLQLASDTRNAKSWAGRGGGRATRAVCV